MTKLTIDDLPKRAREQVLALAETRPFPSKTAMVPRESGTAARADSTLICHTCGDQFTHQTGAKGWENHADMVGHYRFDLDLRRSAT